MRWLGIWVLLWLGCSTVAAQPPYLRNWGFSAGLPSLQIYDLHQHSSGYLYLGNSDGLLRFNGQNFESVPFRDDPAPISYLVEDQRGDLWGRDFSNQLFCQKNDTLRPFTGLDALLKDNLLVAFDLQQDTLWVATETALVAHDLVHQTTRQLWQAPSSEELLLDLKLAGEVLVVATQKNLLLFDRHNGQLLFEHPISLIQTELLLHAGKVFFTNRGYNSEQVYTFDLQRLQLRSLAKLPPNIYGHYLRWWNNGLYWCTNQGLYEIDLSEGKTHFFALSQQRISDLWSDEAGNHWIGTLDHGLYQMPLPEFKRIFQSPQPFEQLKTLGSASDGALLIGSHQGKVWKTTTDGQRIWEVQTPKGDEIQFINALPEKGAIISSVGILEEQSGRVLEMGYFGNKLIVGAQGQWLTTNQYGVFAISQNQEYPELAGEKIIFQDRKAVRLRKQRAYDLNYHPEQASYLVAYTDGLYRYDLQGRATEIRDSLQRPIIARHILRMSNGQYWLSTPAHGIQISDGQQVLLGFNTSHGLSSNHVKKIVYAGDAKCWVLTDKGLDLYDGQTGKFQPYREALALGQTLLFNMLAQGSHLYIASSAGILRLPLQPNKKLSAPQLAVRSAKFNGKDFPLSASRLPRRGGQLQLAFDALMFSDQSQVYGQYRVLPDQKEWTNLPRGLREISLLELPGGTNTVELRLISHDQYSNTFSWQLYVPYPIWLKWWFLLLLLVAIVGSSSWLTRYFNRRRQSAHALQQQLAGSQLTAIKAQMNPHFMYNVLNAIQGLIYANKKEEAADYLAKFSDLMRLTLNVSDKQWHNLNDELSALTLYLELEASRFNGEFRYQIDLEPELRLLAPDLPSMLLQPFLENAIKHGLLHKTGPKWLRIGFQYEPSTELMTIEIEDNGIGRKAGTEIQSKRAPKHRSFATGAIESRIHILNRLLPKPIQVETIDKLNAQQMPTGTLVTLRIPLTKA